MKKGDFLFVYGTLRRGEAADLAEKEFGQGEKHATFVSEDRINGRLFDLGWFPGVKTEPGSFDPGKSSVCGDVFRLDTDGIVGELDAYESFPNLFGRLETETAGGLHVWVYFFNGNPDADRVVASGDWTKHGFDKVNHATPILAD